MEWFKYYQNVIVCDFEFQAPPGERPRPLCMVARDVVTGSEWRLWSDDLPLWRDAPFPTDEHSLFVAYYASAELGCFLALSWPMPRRVLDLFVEFRRATCGLKPPCGSGLLGALVYHGLPTIQSEAKESLRQLAIRGGPYTPAEQSALLDYCASDVEGLARLFTAMAPQIDLPRALLRGRYMAAAARMEWNGIPVERETLQQLVQHWPAIKRKLIQEIDEDFG